MPLRIKFEGVKPGTLFRVRATCSFGPNEDCISEQGHLYASDGIIELPKGTILLLIEANWIERDPHIWYENEPKMVDELSKRVVLFRFLTDQREVYLPINVSLLSVEDPYEAIKNYLEMYLENIQNSVDSQEEL